MKIKVRSIGEKIERTKKTIKLFKNVWDQRMNNVISKVVSVRILLGGKH